MAEQEEMTIQPLLYDVDNLDPKRNILIKGARVNNLKNINVAIPRNKLVVITGLSGSGKSSLAFDTLFAEGQRMYVESLSAYARQFLGRMEKPDVDYIRGVSPAIAIEQKVNTRNPRSTVGTTTEIYDYLKLLFARVGTTYSPISGEAVQRDTVEDVVQFLYSWDESTKFMVLCPMVKHENRTLKEELNILLQKGFSRIQVEWNTGDQPEIYFIEEILEQKALLDKIDQVYVLIDRAAVRHEDEELRYRMADSIQTAFFEGQDTCYIDIVKEEGHERHTFSDRFEKDGMTFEEPSINFFSFNNPYGACDTCGGFGNVLGIDEDLVIPDKSLSVYENAIAPWRSPTMYKWLEPLIKNGIKFDFPIHRAYEDLTEEQKQTLWQGNKHFKGINDFFKFIESKTHKIQYRVLLSRYRGRTPCPDCKGTRLRKDASYVKINNTSITDIVLWPLTKVGDFFNKMELQPHEAEIAERIVTEIQNRIDYLEKVGLSYLTLNRLTSSLSGGEYQRIKLATSLGSALVGSMYILDEPSIGLHPRDTDRLVEVLKTLRDLGNTVIVVEHEEGVIRAADELVDIGPDAGTHGGHLVFQGNISNIEQMNGQANTHTARYLKGLDEVPLPSTRRKALDFLTISGARENNLKNLTVHFPLKVLSVISGVSGSGKSTLISNILYPAVGKYLGSVTETTTGRYDKMEGSYKQISQIEFVDQNPIGKSSRSNPVTYVKAYDAIRQLMAEQPLAQQRNYKPAFFSFNVDGGRCETCQGEGVVKIEMQFMADIFLTCESCSGSRFKQEVMEVKYKEKNIAEILDMTVDDAIEFFRDHKSIIQRLKPLKDVGLGYITLGQSSNSLSGGEAQRVKLASFIGRGHSPQSQNKNILFIFDEPTTGLHFHDINKLLNAVNALVDQGNTVIIIEHNMEIIKSADWVIDLGPEGGEEGGYITFSGTPEDLAKEENNYTARFLKEKVNTLTR